MPVTEPYCAKGAVSDALDGCIRSFGHYITLYLAHKWPGLNGLLEVASPMSSWPSTIVLEGIARTLIRSLSLSLCDL